MWCSPMPLSSYSFDPNIPLLAIFSYTPVLYSALSVRDKVTRPFQTPRKMWPLNEASFSKYFINEITHVLSTCCKLQNNFLQKLLTVPYDRYSPRSLPWSLTVALPICGIKCNKRYYQSTQHIFMKARLHVSAVKVYPSSVLNYKIQKGVSYYCNLVRDLNFNIKNVQML